MTHWFVIVGLLLGSTSPLNTNHEHEVVDQTVCTVDTQTPIAWTTSSTDLPLPDATPSNNDLRQRVTFTNAGGEERAFETLYGSADQKSRLVLTKHNTVNNTPNIQYPDAPGLAVNNGWAFITFRWPLIWMESVQAGSIGTTSVMQTTKNRVDLYLIHNTKDTHNTDPISRPSSCPNEAKLFIRVAGIQDSVCLQVPKDFQGVLRSYSLQRDEHGHVTATTPIEFIVDGNTTQELPLKIIRKDGLIIVGANTTEQEKFLGKVLSCAYLQGLYDVP